MGPDGGGDGGHFVAPNALRSPPMKQIVPPAPPTDSHHDDRTPVIRTTGPPDLESAGRENHRDPAQALNAHHLVPWTKTRALSSLACRPHRLHPARAARHDRPVELLQDDGDACAASSRSGRSNVPIPVCRLMPADARLALDIRPRRLRIGHRWASAQRCGSRRDGWSNRRGPRCRHCSGSTPGCIDHPAPDLMVSGVHRRRDIRVAAPARVLWPGMRGAAVQFICPVAGPTQVRRY